jgi:NADH dehydrogenase/NADH:ubiquinone oxidoreductase subunit G/NAD(P)H-flavin reductase
MSITLSIDGQEVSAPEGQSILECALAHSIDIPHICTHPALPASGTCRLCVVEVEGLRGYPTSCTTPVAEGMVVQTHTEALLKLRRNTLSLMMLEHPSACLVCDKRELCEQYRPHSEKAGRTTGCHTCNNKSGCELRSLSDELAVGDLPISPTYQHKPLDRSNPFIDRDLNLCILCGRCVRICKLQQGTSVIDFVERGSETFIGTAFGRSYEEAGCQFCGSCIDVCPTGALAERYAKWYPKADQALESTCQLCEEACAVRLESSQGKLTSGRAVNERVPICVLGRFAMAEFLNGADRLKTPLMRVGKVLRETPWDTIVPALADKLKAFAGDGFSLICDSANSLEDRYVFRKFTTEVMQSQDYIEIEPNATGPALGSIPAGTKAALLVGALVPTEQLDGLELLIVQDCYPTETSQRADFVLPAAVLAEIAGTVQDTQGCHRPLVQACTAPGLAQAQWRPLCQIAKALGSDGFAYDSVGAIGQDIGISGVALQIDRDQAPPVATDAKQRRSHFRNHLIEDRVRALRELNGAEVRVESEPRPEVSGGFEILKKHEIAPNVHEIVIKAPDIARKAQPGQFVIVMVDGESERVPYTLCDWDPEQGSITLVVLEMGQSSRKLVLRQAGDKLAHLVGPLGVPMEIKNYGTAVLTGGCYGIGAILRMASALKEAGNHVITVVEARSHYKHYYSDKLEAASDELIITTIDGSQNIKGHAVDVVAAKLKDGEKLDLVVAVGCPFMMMLTSRETKPFEVKTLAALNPIMLDGTGMCGACRITVGESTKFACVDGPMFDAHLVDWDEVWDRRSAYSREEIRVVGKTESVTAQHAAGHQCNCK